MKSDNQDKWRRRVRLIKSKISLVPSLHFKRKQKEMQAYSKAKIALKKKVWWNFFLFLRVIFFNTTLLPLKPPLFLPEDARPGHAAHQQRWDVPAETCNYHVITAQEKINRDQTDLQSFIPCSICIQVNNTYIFLICQGFPHSISSQCSWNICKALISLERKAEKEGRMASLG